MNSNHEKHYDVIVVGSRCAGAPLAMLVAQAGYRVLMLDQGQFPSNKMSTHFMKGAGVGFLARWGLLEQLIACGAPPITHWDFNHDGIRVMGRMADVPGVPAEYATRRLELDQLLIEAALTAGVEFEAGFRVEDVLWRDDRVIGVRGVFNGHKVDVRGAIVVGADGMNSRIAERVGARELVSLPTVNCGYYGYFADLPVAHALESHQFSDHQLLLCFPTNADLHVVFLFWPVAQAKQIRRRLKSNFRTALQRVPQLFDKVNHGRQIGNFSGTHQFRHFIRQPWGPGWALAGDAVMHRDPITAYGMTHAFADAELLSQSILACLHGDVSFAAAMSWYQRQRDLIHRPSFHATFGAAGMPPLAGHTKNTLKLLSRGSQDGRDQFVSQLDQSLQPILDMLHKPAVFADSIAALEGHPGQSC